MCVCLSVPTNSETVNLVLFQKHAVTEKYNLAIQYGNYYNKSREVVLTSFCVRVIHYLTLMCVQLKHTHTHICIYICKYTVLSVNEFTPFEK